MKNKDICLGYGGSWHASANNTSMLIISKDFNEDKHGVLLDCGETVFSVLKEKDILKDLKSLTVLITHLHADNVGSLASLIMYYYYKLNNTSEKIKIFFPDEKILVDLLRLQGTEDDLYDIVSNIKDVCNSYLSFEGFIPVKHVSSLKSYSYYYTDYKNDLYIYTGDLAHLNDELLYLINKNNLKRVYMDIDVSNKSKVHLNLKEIIDKISKDKYNKIYAMHLNDDKDIDILNSLGINNIKEL